MVRDSEAVPLTEHDLTEIVDYLDAIRRLNDSKLDRLRRDLDRPRASGQSAIVFTQFTDTLDYLRDRLVHAYREHLATYSGAGGRMYSANDDRWQDVSSSTWSLPSVAVVAASCSPPTPPASASTSRQPAFW